MYHTDFLRERKKKEDQALDTNLFTDFDTISHASWSHEDEFDLQAAANVSKLFDQLDVFLYSDVALAAQTPIERECVQWRTR
jgi:hypothetical protein